MGLFRKRAEFIPLSDEEIHASIQARHKRQAEKDQAILYMIGQRTDPLADEAIRLYEQLPVSERTQFIHNVFRRLIVQALYTADSLDPTHINNFGYGVLDNFGHGSHATVYIGAEEGLARAVIDDSLPRFEQSELELTND